MKTWIKIKVESGEKLKLIQEKRGNVSLLRHFLCSALTVEGRKWKSGRKKP